MPGGTAPGSPSTRSSLRTAAPPASPSFSATDPSSLDFGPDDFSSGPITNPYASTPTSFPSTPGYSQRSFAAPKRGGRSEALYIIPAAFILVWSILLILGSLFRLVSLGILMATNDIPAEAIPRVIGFVVGTILGGVVGCAMIIGAINMLRRINISSARTSAILAALPCFGGCVFPIGIWAAILLYSGSAEKDFSD